MKETLSKLEEVLDGKKTELREAESVRNKAQGNVSTEQGKVDTAKAEEKDASNAVTNTENTISEKKNLIDTLTGGMDAVKNRVQAAMDKIAQGSAGFFDSLGEAGKKAAQAVRNPNINEDQKTYHNLGEKGDATTLENMKKAIDMIIIGNKYRTEDLDYRKDTYGENRNLNDLKISNEAMAQAQINANLSYTKKDGLHHTMYNDLLNGM